MLQNLQTVSLQDNTKRGAADIAALLFVFIASALPFIAASRFGIVNCDDYDYIRYVSEGKSIFGLGQAIFMPVTWLSYKLDILLAHALNIGPARLAHVQSIVWHALNSVLLYCVFRRLFSGAGRFAAVAGALLWAVHPLRVESVVWIASRKDVVSMFFLLAAWLCWINSCRGRRLLLYPASLLLMLLGCCAKPSVMVLPAAMMLSDVLVLSQRPALNRRGIEHFARPYLPFIVISGVTAVLASIAQKAGGAMDVQQTIPFWWKACNAVASIGVYVKHLFYPFDLAPQCLVRWPGLPKGLLPGVAVCLIIAVLVAALAKRWRTPACGYALCGILIFAVALLPMLGIVGFGIHAFADRFTYIPAVGFSVVAVAVLQGLRRGRSSIAVLPLAVALLAVQSYRQSLHWRDDGTLWSHTIEVDGERNHEAQIALGLYHFEFGHDLDAAVDCFSKAFAANPERSGRILFYWLLALCEKGDREAARRVYGDLSAWNAKKVREARAVGLDVGATIDYLVGRLVFLNGDPSFREMVKADGRELKERFPDNIHVKYLLYRLGELPAKDVTPSDPMEYVQYRYVRDCL